MANHLKIIGEAYKQFKDTNTSLSAAKSPHHIRAFQRYFLTKEENNKCTNASLTLGTITHDVTEKAWVENKTIEEVFNSKIIQDKINNYVPFDEKDKMKFQFGLKYLKDIAKNHHSYAILPPPLVKRSATVCEKYVIAITICGIARIIKK